MNSPATRRERRKQQAPMSKGDRRESAILDSLERLLAETPLTAISVDDIAKGAGISRSTLYFYFRSRLEVFAALLRRTTTNARRTLLGEGEGQARERVTQSLEQVLEAWRSHHPVLRTAVEGTGDPMVADLWRQAMGDQVASLAEWIERARAEGLAIDTGVPSADVAEALVWMVERGFQQLFSREHAEGEERQLVRTFATIILRAAGFDH